MIKSFETLVKPSQAKLEKTLGTKLIDVKYIPTELKATYGYKRVNIETKKVTYGRQFDPLGYIAFKESRQ